MIPATSVVVVGGVPILKEGGTARHMLCCEELSQFGWSCYMDVCEKAASCLQQWFILSLQDILR